jgi:ribosomal protein S18 acetylase RimI-like enzyme
VACVMVGHDGHRGTVYYVSVDPALQGRGLGRQVMAAAEGWLAERGIWKLNLLLRADNEKTRGFYEALGYEVEPRLCMARKLIER